MQLHTYAVLELHMYAIWNTLFIIRTNKPKHTFRYRIRHYW